jgi:hypothetical protein
MKAAFSFVLAIAIATGAQAQEPGRGSAATFTSADGRFTVRSPLTLRPVVQDLDLGGGVHSSFHAFIGEGDDVSYTVGYIDYPPDMSDQPVRRLNRMVLGHGKRVIHTESLQLGEFPGRAAEIEIDGGTVSQRDYFVGSRLYQVVVTRRAGTPSSPADRDFLESFAVTGARDSQPTAPLSDPRPAPAPKPTLADAFNSVEGRFTVRAPVHWTEASEEGDLGEGVRVTLHSFSGTSDGILFAVRWSDAPKAVDLSHPDAFVEEAAGSRFLGHGASLVRKASLSLGEHPGFESQIDVSVSRVSLRIRTYLVGRRLYQLVTRQPMGAPDAPIARQFMESFALYDPSKSSHSVPASPAP